MSRNFGIPSATSGAAPGEQQRPRSYSAHDTQRAGSNVIQFGDDEGIPIVQRGGRFPESQPAVSSSFRASDLIPSRSRLTSHAPNSLAGVPPSNLAVVRGSPFTSERKLQPVEPLDPRIDHREFAVLVVFSILLSVTFGLPLAIAVAFMSFG